MLVQTEHPGWDETRAWIGRIGKRGVFRLNGKPKRALLRKLQVELPSHTRLFTLEVDGETIHTADLAEIKSPDRRSEQR